MPIPRDITRQDVLDALRDLADGVPPGFGPPTRYELVYRRRRYPPKPVVGLAARRVLGRVLEPVQYRARIGRRDA